MTIITDTREQRPFWSNNYKTLTVGDYTTTRLLNVFHIERKSLQDLYGTLVQGNARFKHELFRAAYHGITLAVYVEGTRNDFINKNFPRGEERRFPSEGLDKMIKTFEKKYYLEFRWHASRSICIRETRKRLEAEELRLPGKARAGGKKARVTR
jgi:ERCC4-type nuclease